MKEQYFREWSSSMSYILGFTMADGSMKYRGYSDSFSGPGS